MSYRHLTLRERYIIQELRELGKNLSFISRELSVDRSTVSREVRRNSNSQGGYRALGAQSVAKARKPGRLDYPRKIDGAFKELIVQKLEEGWSPEQINGRLKLEGKQSVSIEGIYRFVLMDRKHGGKLYKLLRRHGRKQRRGYQRNRHWVKIKQRRFIDERSANANTRKALGHWERDLVHGTQQGPAVLTIVDRKSRYTLLEKVQNRTHDESAAKTTRAFKRTGLRCSTLTNDNGAEFGGFQELEKQLRTKIFYTHPYCSWERGTNENTNGLLRQYLPKGISYRTLTDKYLQVLEQKLNQRPRKTLNYRTPEEIHYSKRTNLIKGMRRYSNDRLQRFIEETDRIFAALAL